MVITFFSLQGSHFIGVGSSMKTTAEDLPDSLKNRPLKNNWNDRVSFGHHF